jgi:protein-disulfide isomerase
MRIVLTLSLLLSSWFFGTARASSSFLGLDDTLLSLTLEGSPSLGPKDAKVTFVCSASFQCPYSARIQATLEAVLDRYPDDVRLVFKHNPLAFHKRAMPAAKAAMAAHLQGKFWEYRDLIFDNLRELEDEDLEAYAVSLDLRLKWWRKDLKSDEIETKILHDQAALVGHGARGTPACFINGKLSSGAKSFDAFDKEVKSALKAANRLIASGVRKKDIHAKAARKNAGASFVESIIKGKKAPPPPAPPAPPAPKRSKNAPPTHVDMRKHIRAQDPSIGPQNAPVTWTVFYSLQCPYSKRLHETMRELLDSYDKEIRVVFKQRPLGFHKHAKAAALATLAAHAQGKHFEYLDLVFENQKELTEESFESFARHLDLNVSQFNRFIASRKAKAHLKRDMKSADKVGARGTPVSFINGERVKGAQPLEVFVEKLNKAYDKATGLMP